MMRAVAWILRAIAAVAFIAAGATKAMHPAAFIADIWSYRILPEDTAYWVAAFLPWLEIVTGLALLTGRQLAGARALALGMLGVFLVAIVAAWVRGLDIACGCFGAGAVASDTSGYLWLVVRDLALIACLVADPILARRAAARPRRA